MKFNTEQEKFLRQTLTAMRIIAGSLIAGVLIFLGVVLFVLENNKPSPPFIAYLAAVTAIVAILLSYFIPGFVCRNITQALVEGTEPQLPAQFKFAPDVGVVGQLLYVFHMRLIVGLAILEGAAFFNVVAYMLERQQVSLLMVGLLLAAMLVKFPTRSGLENRLATETKLIDELRSLRP